MGALFLGGSAALLIVTAGIHSIIGQRRLIGPLLSQTSGVLKYPLARFLIPFAWHLTSATWLVLASILLAWALEPALARTIGLLATGAVFTIAGVYDAFGSRGRHIGWPLLAAVGLAALTALFLGGGEATAIAVELV